MGGSSLSMEGPFCISSPIDPYIRRILSALVWLELASLHLTQPSLSSAYLAVGLTQSESAHFCLIRIGSTHGPRLMDVARGTTSVARRGAISPLTSCPDWAFLGLNLAIENIRACEHRGTMGRLSCAQLVVQSPAPGSVTHNLLIPSSSPNVATTLNHRPPGSRLVGPRPILPPPTCSDGTFDKHNQAAMHGRKPPAD